MEGKQGLIGLTDVWRRSEWRDKRRERGGEEPANVSRLVYIVVFFVTAEQPMKSHKRRKYRKRKNRKQQTKALIISVFRYSFFFKWSSCFRYRSISHLSPKPEFNSFKFIMDLSIIRNPVCYISYWYMRIKWFVKHALLEQNPQMKKRKKKLSFFFFFPNPLGDEEQPTSSHWSLSTSISLCKKPASALGIFSSSLCRSSTVVMSWSMSSCFSLSSALAASCLTGQKEKGRAGKCQCLTTRGSEAAQTGKVAAAVPVTASACQRAADNVN